MSVSAKAKEIIDRFQAKSPMMGDIKKIAKEIKRDHALAQELWSTESYFPRLLAVLIFEGKLLSQEILDGLSQDMEAHPYQEMNQIADWLLANQLTKSKKTLSLLESWENSTHAVQRRLFWYHQGRIRWSTKALPDNADALLSVLEEKLEVEVPTVQWAMNFAAGQIGVHEPSFRQRCIDLGLRVGLYRDDKVAKNCTPSYIPEWIRIESAKLGN